jgi:hypothetical protein
VSRLAEHRRRHDPLCVDELAYALALEARIRKNHKRAPAAISESWRGHPAAMLDQIRIALTIPRDRRHHPGGGKNSSRARAPAWRTHTLARN